MDDNKVSYKVVEKFVSINGEGTRAGQLAVFIRLKGCNLDCSFCDTKWANQADAKHELSTVEELVDYVVRSGVKNVTLTGGEPLLQDNIHVLINSLIDAGRDVEIETNGSVELKRFKERCPANVTFTMDYKLGGSGMEKFMCLDNMSLLSEQDTVKFVVGSISDLDRARQVIEEYQLCGRCNVYISPVFGSIELNDIVEYMKTNRMNQVNMQIQMHKVIWNPSMRGV